MAPIRLGRAPLHCCFVLVASFGVDALARMPATPAEPGTASPARGRHIARPVDASHASERTGDGSARGDASYYAHHLDGRKTASGQAYDPDALTAAHRTLPLGTKVRVVNPKNDKSVVVTVNDRGPVPKNRMIDVSSAAADQLEMKKSGVTKVETRVVGKTDLPQGDRVGAR